MSRFADQIDVGEMLSELGDGEIVYTPRGGQPRTINGIFEEHYQFVKFDGGDIGVQTEQPVVLCKRSDVVGVGTKGDTIQVDGTTYYVTGIQPHADMMRLLLCEDNPNE